MAKTFYDYLNSANKKTYEYLLSDEERFEDYNMVLRAYVLTQGHGCLFQGARTYEDAERFNTVEEISEIVNKFITPYIVSRQYVAESSMLSYEERELELTLAGL